MTDDVWTYQKLLAADQVAAVCELLGLDPELVVSVTVSAGGMDVTQRAEPMRSQSITGGSGALDAQR